jgi:hypothetical protein
LQFLFFPHEITAINQLTEIFLKHLEEIKIGDFNKTRLSTTCKKRKKSGFDIKKITSANSSDPNLGSLFSKIMVCLFSLQIICLLYFGNLLGVFAGKMNANEWSAAN